MGIWKQKVVYPSNEALFGNKKEWSTDTCYTTDEPETQYTRWMKSDHVLHDSMNVCFKNRVNYRNGTSGCLDLREGAETESANGHGGSFQGIDVF